MLLKEKILELRESGLTYSEISKRLKCSKGTISYHCSISVKIKTSVRMRDRRNKLRKLLQELKTNKPCGDCGDTYPYFVMDFDHRPGEDKKFNVGMVNTIGSVSKMLEEIKKCDLVCSNCHRIRSWVRITKNFMEESRKDKELVLKTSGA